METLLSRYATIPVERTRCFSIIAHIDHGKSTLADRLLEWTGNIDAAAVRSGQVLDNLSVERERGITVKAQSASMIYVHGGEEYLLHLIDTPGHVDFAYEVCRAMAACQGALLLVDASQGVQAQTVGNYHVAMRAGLTIVPVLTKMDLPTADPEPCLAAMEAVFGLPQDVPLWTSAKTGEGVLEVLNAIVERVPPPGSSALRDASLRALLFDSWYDPYRGVVCSVLVVEGTLRAGDVIQAAHSGDKFTVQEVGLIAPNKVPVDTITGPLSGAGRRGGLSAGHMGYLIAGMKSTKQALVGDTFVSAASPALPLPGFAPSKPMVFASLYPLDTSDFAALVTAVDRLTLNDASVQVVRESSSSLGLGLRCGFLGLLHMDVFHQRLQQEFDCPVIITAPMVPYRITLHSGEVLTVERPGDFPSAHSVAYYEEPTVSVSIMTPSVYVSPLMALLNARRGVQEDVIYLDAAAAAAADAQGGYTAPPEAAAAVEEVSVSEAAVEEEEEDDDDDEDEDEADAETRPTESLHRPPAGASDALHSRNSTGGPRALTSDRVVMKYRVPWAEVVVDMNDAVKSATQGYASVDWIPAPYQRAEIVRVEMCINAKPVDALSFVAHRDKAVSEGRRVAVKLRGVISRQQFEIIIQAIINGKIVARERIAPFRKDVLSKSGKTVGGGDKSRKQKLLSKQKEGKKRMKTVADVQLSQEAFHSIMTRDGT